MAEIQKFIASESSEEFKAELSAAMSDPVPFRAFMMALVGKPDAKARWSAIREGGIGARMRAFCAEHDVVIDDSRFSSSD